MLDGASVAPMSHVCVCLQEIRKYKVKITSEVQREHTHTGSMANLHTYTFSFRKERILKNQEAEKRLKHKK
jgi:hypothetical protein